MKKEKPLRSTESQVDSFMASSVWADMSTLIEERLDFLSEQLADMPLTDINEIIELKGQLRALRDLRELPKILKKNILIDINNNKKEEQNHA